MADISDKLPPPKRCDNCNSSRIRLHKNHRRNRNKYVCQRCYASVYCHKGTNIPLGYMATAHTRYLRAKAHEAFDVLWRHSLLTRDEAYEWLARILGIALENAHIGRLTDAQLERVIAKSGRHYRRVKTRTKKRKAVQSATYRRQRAYTEQRKRRHGGKWKPTPNRYE
ncbi:hypothetical protein [Paracoccus phage vB_PmaS-R3]|uniref:Uncharacterized protein n=1 Tax=Paracoccus phage vB_PmaS-R3 TaxID=2494563 RepID=A0A0B5A7I3_9CAUD|nr:hypothetical protein VC48_gp07 [Paracoccus phage vB_PmaS-R3]AJD83131.1 hypothetical protein [Paracoccus phage vB_PmaS-R3]